MMSQCVAVCCGVEVSSRCGVVSQTWWCCGVADVAFDELTSNPFFNVNKPEDIELGEQQLVNK